MKNFYKAEYNGKTYLRTSANEYTFATIYDFTIIGGRWADSGVGVTFHARFDLAGKKMNGCFAATTIVPVVQITAAEYKELDKAAKAEYAAQAAK